LTIVAPVLVTAGCATVESPLADLPDDIAPMRAEREEEAVEELKRTRDGAIYQAALSRWRDGDAAACESLLVRLLKQSNEHREARLMLADLYTSTGKPKAAEQHLRLLIERTADDAQAHHSLGMLLQMTGRADEALPHLQKAADLEPDNELYALSHDAARADSKTSPKQRHSSRAANAKPDSSAGEIKE
jgi:tetratricopeptide (TPR) repeat protein